MRNYSFYHVGTGMIHTRTISCPDDQLEANTPKDHKALVGYHDCLCKKFDLDKKQVVDYQPPQPSLKHVWHDDIKRWVFTDPEGDVRKERDRLLAESDWVTLRSSDSGVPLSKEWKDYRQALRDIPLQAGFPATVEWPLKPS